MSTTTRKASPARRTRRTPAADAPQTLDALAATDPRLPLYQRLKDAFVAQLASRRWRPGEAIPTEAELCRAYGASIGTVRHTIELLALDGLLEKTPGRGTFVRTPSFEGSLFRFFRHRAGGEDRVPQGRILSRAVRLPPSEVGESLRMAPRERAIVLERLRSFDDVPFLCEEIWLPQSRFAALARLPLAEFGNLLYPQYERHCGQTVASAREHLSVAQARGVVADRLRLAPGAPVVVIERLAFGYDRSPLEWRRSHGIAERFRYDVDIR